MIKIIFGIALILFNVLSVDARKPKDPCKDAEVTTDAFGKTTKGISKTLDMNQGTWISLMQVDGITTLKTTFYRAGASDAVLPKGSICYLAFYDDAFLEIPIAVECPAVRTANPWSLFMQWSIECVADKAVLAKYPRMPLRFHAQ